jgi:hypothetical protein
MHTESGGHPDGRERWLLLFNCQTTGLTNCFNLLNPGFNVEGADIWRFNEDPDRYNMRIRDYFRVVAHPEFTQHAAFRKDDAPHLTILPEVFFEAYHPDLGYFNDEHGQPVSGPLNHYQSIIAAAGYNNGLSPEETLALYHARTYEAGRYFGLWVPARDRLVAKFASFGLDIRPAFLRWGLRSPFMYGSNHPRIEVLHDVARIFMESHGVTTFDGGIRPADNLANGPCFPVYPEIGESLGVEGTYLFKVISRYSYMTLEEFVRASFEVYSRHPRGTLQPSGGYEPRYTRIEAFIRGAA